MKRYLSIFTLFVLLAACDTPESSDVTQQPTLADYQVGEKWVWKYKGVTTAGEVRSEGADTREIILTNGILSMATAKDTISVTDIVRKDESKTPKYAWPMRVGKKWKYENNWTSEDGTTGSQNQQAEIVSYQEEEVEAGTFMAYTIKYTGRTTNSRGYDAEEEEVWLYAPSVKNFIKLTQSQGDFLYVEELIEYSRPE